MQATITYRGMSDASAAVALDQRTFLVGDDEQSLLCVYRVDRPDEPIQRIAADTYLGRGGKRSREADLEGAAARGNRVYWITSHGRNHQGKWSPSRQRFFAIDWEWKGDQIAVRPFGAAYGRLAYDLAEDRRLKSLGVADAIRPEEQENPQLAPKRAGLNIEGLAAGLDGKSLLLGFRNPRPDGKALIVPLLNPDAILHDGHRAELGDPVLVDLSVTSDGRRHALGLRDLALAGSPGPYWLLAGPHDEGRVFAVYQWSGRSADAPCRLAKATEALAAIPAFSPEAIVYFSSSGKVQLLSDDGSLLVKVGSAAECKKGAFHAGKCEAKSLLDDARKTFRGRWVARG